MQSQSNHSLVDDLSVLVWSEETPESRDHAVDPILLGVFQEYLFHTDAHDISRPCDHYVHDTYQYPMCLRPIHEEP